MSRRAARTPFQRWVLGYGAARLARDLGRTAYGQPLTAHAVHHWAAGRTRPRPAAAVQIVRLSNGAVRLADIYGDERES